VAQRKGRVDNARVVDTRVPELLSRLDLFEHLSRTELNRLARIVKPLAYATGEMITEEGTRGGRFHVIESGTATVVVGGRTHAKRGPGEYVGELALLDGGPRSASVIALEPVRTWSIAEWDFRRLLKDNGPIAYKLLVTVTGRLRAALDAAYLD
jgi:CRP-like cAMP-binding protein